MSFFNFFGRNKNNRNSQISLEKIEETDIDEALFVDSNKPMQQLDTPEIVSNPVCLFLERNFESQGYNDGYACPNAELLEISMRRIRSEFRVAVDRCIDKLRTEINELRKDIINTTGISDRLVSQLKEKIVHLEQLLHEWDTQKILSVEDEGMVGPSIYSYHRGFIKGLNRFQEEKHFGNSTGLFNK